MSSAFVDRSSRRRRGAPALALVVVVALHLALFWLLRDAAVSRPERDVRAAPTTRVTLRLIAPPPLRAAVPPAALAKREAPPGTPTRSAAPSRTMTTPTPTPTPESIDASRTPSLAHAEPAASAPDASGPSLLDSDATRRAIRASARAPSLRDQLAAARDEPARIGANELLAHGIKDAGKGECLKGEFAGAGLGLLSLPFLAVAAASGNCAK